MAEQWKKGDPVWYLRDCWRKGVLERVRRYASGEAMYVYRVADGADRPCPGVDVVSPGDLRRRDPAKKGKDRPTAESEARRDDERSGFGL